MPFNGMELIARINGLMGATEQSAEDVQGLTVYIYIQRTKIIGFMSVETIQATMVVTKKYADDDDKKESSTASIGVSRIWVSTEHRQRGIALKLLQSIRICTHIAAIQCSSICIPSPQSIAFSQPTSLGRAIALKFHGNGAFLCYT